MSTDKYMDIEKLEAELFTCTMCGFCKNVCPVFIDNHWDSSAPRGRMTMAYGLISGQLEPDEALLNNLFQCTQCQDCLRRCPSNAACPDVTLAARREMVKRGKTAEYQEQLVKNIQKTGNIYADEEVGIEPKTGDYQFFIGCQYLSRPNSIKKVIKLLKRIGINPELMDESCCGFPLHIMGFEKENQEQKAKLLDKVTFSGKDILTICPSCLKQLKEEYQQPVIHILELIDSKRDVINVTKPVGKKVTYHDPCDLSRGAGIIKEPRQILEFIGCEIVEMPYSGDTSRCCGGGGGILTWDEELSLRMAKRRIEEARATGAEMLVTACPTCEQNLKRGARAEADETGRKPLPVRHIIDLLVKATR